MLTLLLIGTFILLPKIDAQPSDWIRLTTNLHGDSHPRYSPDGEKIAFVRQRSDHWHRDIWIMDADGSNPEPLVWGPGGGLGLPDWSPDGTKIVYQEYVYDDRNGDLKFIDVNSREITIVVEDWGSNHCPIWSHDGAKIYFSHCDVLPFLWNLYSINVDGTGLTKITDWQDPIYHQEFDLSPDELKIVVTKLGDIFMMDADGTNEVKLADNGWQPEFFPDGERIVFGDNSYANLFSVNIDATNMIQLTDCPSNIGVQGPTVSPDSREIAFSAGPPGQHEGWYIYKIFLPCSAILDIDPNTLNLRSNGEWVTAYIELSESYDVSEIDVGSILLNDTIPVDVEAPITIGDYDVDAIPDLMAKFDRAAIIEWLDTNDYGEDTGKYYEINLTITGTVSGTQFTGTDQVKVLKR